MNQASKTLSTPIDIVYLWVNGNDGEWRAKREKYAQKLEAVDNLSFAKFGNVEGRYRDNDELRFSLRAIEKFFPEHGHVYIVTDGQVPDWFQASDQMTLVDHHQLIPHSALHPPHTRLVRTLFLFERRCVLWCTSMFGKLVL